MSSMAANLRHVCGTDVAQLRQDRKGGDGRTGVKVPRDTWISPKVEMRSSSVHGRGTFALADISQGEVAEIWGERWRGEATCESISFSQWVRRGVVVRAGVVRPFADGR